MMRRLRLGSLGLGMIALSFLTGLGAAWLWLSSSQNWQNHLTRSYVAGISLDATLRRGTPPPSGVDVAPLSPEDTALMEQGEYLRLPRVPKPAFVTNISLHETTVDPLSGEALTLVIVSPALRYNVSEISAGLGQSTAEKLGSVTKLLATYCSKPILFARVGDRAWHRIDGTKVWGCSAAPTDLRLLGLLFAVVVLAVLGTVLIDTLNHFRRFAKALKGRARLGGPERYSSDGPAELDEIVSAVNTYLEKEREQLRKRAVVLSGVSHDLGTPATRLRLRAALIPEAELRKKFEADIDSMTGMIESVLTYTRSELNTEEPRRISLLSFVQSIVDDFSDMGHPVSLCQQAPRPVEGGASIFSANPGQGSLASEPRILITGRPVELQRAVTNLIDNALKYGRRARVELVADAETAMISIEDESNDMSPEDIEAVFAPFKRGGNAASIDGFGLGLTIVATVAEQHGGRLFFEQGANGLRACFEISRG